MTIIDPFYLYLILQLDSIKDLLAIACFVSGLAVAVLVFVSAIFKSESGYSWNSDEKKDAYRQDCAKAIKAAKSCTVVLIVLASLNALTPTSERMAILVVLPAVANSESVQAEARELYDLAKRGLGSLVATTDEPKAGETKP